MVGIDGKRQAFKYVTGSAVTISGPERHSTDKFSLKGAGMNNKKAHGIEMPWAVELVGPHRALRLSWGFSVRPGRSFSCAAPSRSRGPGAAGYGPRASGA